MGQLSASIDYSGLEAGMALARRWTSRTCAQAANAAGFWIAKNCMDTMPYVPIQRIDDELGTIVEARIGARGKPLSTKYSKNRLIRATKKGDINTSYPLATLIIIARLRAGSNYNAITNNRWVLTQNPFSGISRKDLMSGSVHLPIVQRMINARHSSIKFLAAGFGPAVRTLYGLGNKYLLGHNVPINLQTGDEFGRAYVATETNPVCIIENLIGTKGVNAENYNQALMQYGLPTAQRVVDFEGVRQVNYFLRKSHEEELMIPFNKLSGP